MTHIKRFFIEQKLDIRVGRRGAVDTQKTTQSSHWVFNVCVAAD